MLARWPVQEIVSITEDSTLLSETDYEHELDPEPGFIWKLSGDNRTSWTGSRVTIVYTAGYELLQQLPQSLERACISMVKQYRSGSTRDPLIKSVDVFEVQRTDYGTYGAGSKESMGAANPEIAALLNPYRNITV